MQNQFAITDGQKAILRSYTCERLTARAENAALIQEFENEDGPGLVESLQQRGWSDDKKGKVAYYVVKNSDGEIVLFFSLKCGILFDKDALVGFIDQFRDEKLQDLWRRFKQGEPRAVKYFKMLLTTYGQDHYDFLIDNLKKLDSIKLDKKAEPKMVQVFDSHSAIELVEFCSNDCAKHCWDLEQMGFNRMGETMFWWFIVPTMQRVGDLIGSEYAFLFAADRTPDGTLVQYYEDSLHFVKMPALGTIKPMYDLNCYFMGKRIRSVRGSYNDREELRIDKDIHGLDHYRKEFFDNFNLRRVDDSCDVYGENAI